MKVDNTNDNPQHGKLQKFGPNEMKLITWMKINSHEWDWNKKNWHSSQMKNEHANKNYESNIIYRDKTLK